MRRNGLIVFAGVTVACAAVSGCGRHQAQAAAPESVDKPAGTAPEMSLRGFAHRVAGRGVTLDDMTGPGNSDAELELVADFRDCAGADRFRVGESYAVVEVFELRRRSDAAYFQDFLGAGTRYALVGNIAILDDERSGESGLDQLIPVIGAMNGSVLVAGEDGSLADDEYMMLASVRAWRDALRAQVAIELYRDREGRAPWEAGRAGTQWQPLLGDYLSQAPRNPLSPAGVASKVVTTSDPSATGLVVSPDQAGWLWNAATEKLYPAGIASAE